MESFYPSPGGWPPNYIKCLDPLRTVTSFKDSDQSRLDGRLRGQTKLASKGLHTLYTLHRFWTLHNCRALRKRNGRGLAHMHPLLLRVQVILQLLSSTILGRLRTMKANIHLYSLSPNTFLVQHKHMHSSAILKLWHTLWHTHVRMHARMPASTYTWCLLIFAPTMPCICL